MNRLNPRRKLMLSTAGTLIVTSGVLAFVTWPSFRAIRNLSDQIYGERTQLEALYLRGQVLKQTLREFEEVKPKASALNGIYVKRGDELTFIKALEHVAASHGVTQEIRLGASDPKQSDNRLPFQLEASGPLKAVLAYLGGLEALDYYVNVDTVRLSAASANDQAARTAKSPSIGIILQATAYLTP